MAATFAFPAKLYPIVDNLGDARWSHLGLAQGMLEAGVRFLQLRVKGEPSGRFVEMARAVKQLADGWQAQLIINDRADIAQLVDAAGVHLGQSDLPPSAARRLLGPNKIVGYSTHNLDQADAAARSGLVDYVGFGPIFPTTSKVNPDPVQGLEELRAVRRRVQVPIVAIGGVTAATMREVLAAGADAVAMIGELVRAPDLRAAVQMLMQM